MNRLVWWALLVVAVAPATVTGQTLARRVSALENATARLTYPTRPGVEICDQGVRVGGDRMRWHTGRWDDLESNCRPGPAEIEIQVRDGRVRGVELVRGVRDRTPDAVELGSAGAREAADFLLEVARTGGGVGRGEEDALFPAVLADVDGLWRDLLDMAKDRTVDTDIRSGALFWVGQEAAEVVTEGLADLAMDEDEDQDVREAAVFALSQRPNDQAVPILMEIARTAEQADTRRSAMFWLAQSEDERVYAFFESVLTGGGGG